jgi:urea transport system substrate-binding protein
MTTEAKTEERDAGQQSSEIESAERPEERLGISRRGFIAGATAAGAAAGLASFPAIHVRAQESGPIKFGLLEDRSGNFALFGTPKYHGTQLAIKEINEGKTLRSGPTGPGGKGTPQGYDDTDEILVDSGEKGVLGRQIELVAPDPQSENRVFQQLARRLILEDKVAVLMGGFASAEREAIRPIMDQTKQLYFYNNQYEGGVADKYTFCTGAVAEQQIIPAMEYMVANFGNRIYTPAADYNFGQLSAMWTRAFAPVLNAKVVGEEFIPLSVSDFTSTIARIQNAKPDWLMMYITGQNHSNYYPQANAAGVHYPMGSSINMAQGYEHKRFAPPALAGMHVAVNYMEEIPTARNQAFVKRWRAMFPDEPYISQQSQNAYIATHLYAAAARLAKTTDQAAVIEALESGIGLEAPEGWVFMDPATHHLSHYIRIARAEKDHSITFVQEWPHIEPWWLRRLGVNLVRTPEFKQYTPEEDPYFKKNL